MGNCCSFVESENTCNEIAYTSGYGNDTEDGYNLEYRLSVSKPSSEINYSDWEFPDALAFPRQDASAADLHYRICDHISSNDRNYDLKASSQGLNISDSSGLNFNERILNAKGLSSSYTRDLKATTSEAILGSKCYDLETMCHSKNPQTTIDDTFQELPIMTWHYKQSLDQPVATEFMSKPADSEEKSWNLPLSKIISIGNHGLSIGTLGCELTLGPEIQLSFMGVDLLECNKSTNNKFGLFQK